MKAPLRVPRLALLAALACGLVAPPVLAQAFGRVTFILTDAQGAPVQGAKITVTTPEITTFLEEVTTDRRGRANVGFSDATKVYLVKVEHADFPPITTQVKPEIRTTVVSEITLRKSEAPTEEQVQSGQVEVRYTPTEKTFNTGVEALRADDFATAEQKLREALELTPDYGPALSALAGLYLHQQRYQEALDTAERYAAVDPGSARTARLLYEAHKGLGHDAEAKAQLELLAGMGDGGGDTAAMLYNEAVGAIKVGDHATGKQLLLRSLEVQADLAPAWAALALVHVLDEEWAEAAAAAEKHLALAPGNAQSLRLRYDAYKAMGDTAKADAAFAELSAADPAAAATSFYKAGVDAFENGDMAGAAENLARAVELDPANARAHYHLGLAYVNLEQPGKAREHLQRFIDLAPADDPEVPLARDMLGYLQ